MITCPPVNPSRLYISAYSFAGLSVAKFSAGAESDFAVKAFCLSSMRVEPTICLTWPEWRSMHGRNFMMIAARTVGIRGVDSR